MLGLARARPNLRSRRSLVPNPFRELWHLGGAPPFIVIAARDPVPERRVRPVACCGCQPMFDRVEVDVVNMASEIRFIADGMLPETGAATPPARPWSVGFRSDQESHGPLCRRE